MYEQEKITPYGEDSEKAAQVEQMFDDIAPTYDTLNHRLSWNIDKGWRRKAIKELAAHQPQTMLDIATGTGDFALLAAQMLKPRKLIGTDISEGMMEIGRQKVKEAHLEDIITFERQDCLDLSYPDGSFDAVTAAFGIRNFQSLDKGLAEIKDFVLGTDGSGAANLMLHSGASRQPEKTGVETTDDDGHVNREDFLYMNGSAIFNFTLETVPPLMKVLLTKSGLEKAEVDYFVFHQANKYMLSTLRKVCGIPSDRFYIDLEETGNTVSSTILIGLKECLKAGTIVHGMKVMVCGFGVGLSYGAGMLQF